MKVIHVARKPLGETSVALNCTKTGAGALNINASRVGTEVVSTHSRGSNQAFPKRPGDRTAEDSGRKKRQDIVDHSSRVGRWPTNLILQGDHEEAFGEASRFFKQVGGKTHDG